MCSIILLNRVGFANSQGFGPISGVTLEHTKQPMRPMPCPDNPLLEHLLSIPEIDPVHPPSVAGWAPGPLGPGAPGLTLERLGRVHGDFKDLTGT